MAKAKNMIIQSVSSPTTNNYNLAQHNLTPLFMENKSKSIELTPEQKNTLQDDMHAKLAEQVANIKSTYQTAKDMDLTHAYYQQQQKLIDIYIQPNSNDVSNINNGNTSAVHTLTNAYASLYNLHQQIKEIGQQSPSLPDKNSDPMNSLEGLQIEQRLPLTQRQVDTFNNFMMPTTKSYLHLSA